MISQASLITACVRDQRPGTGYDREKERETQRERERRGRLECLNKESLSSL